MTELINRLKSIADQYKVKVTFNADTEENNNGGCAENERWLGEFDDVDLLTIAFFHELAHCLSQAVLVHRKYCSSRLADEGFAWEYGFELAAQYGFTWDIKHKVYKYAEKNLRSYIYQEKINQTNKEWFNALPTKDKAKVLYNIATACGLCMDGGCPRGKTICDGIEYCIFESEENVVKWLKEVHKDV